MAVSERVHRVRAGDRRAMAALMRDLDDDRPGALDDVLALGAGGDAGAPPPAPFVVGITGSPGVGKSTLVDALVAAWRARGQQVGVLAVDPTSPLGGGAILGDRVRMQRHATDDGVFIRSIASRGAQGGLSRSAGDMIAVLAAGGFPSVLIETVGIGQAEVDVASAADVTVVVTVPGLGDDIQALKSGVFEIADVLVVNKSDRPGADQAIRDLEAMLDLRWRAAASTAPVPGPGPGPGRGQVDAGSPSVDVSHTFDVPILRVVATSGVGLPALVAAIDTVHAARAAATPDRRRRQAEARILGLVMARTGTAARAALGAGGDAAELADQVATHRLGLQAAADALMARLRAGY